MYTYSHGLLHHLIHDARLGSQRLPHKKTGPVWRRYFLVPLVAVIVIIVFILVLSFTLQVDIRPAGLKAFNISGGPGAGDYAVFFALVDKNDVNGPASGYVYFKILDVNRTVLYNSEFQVRLYNFSTFSNYSSGQPVVGYRWIIPLENVTAGVPFANGMGRAEFMFLALYGGFIDSDMNIPIPEALNRGNQ